MPDQILSYASPEIDHEDSSRPGWPAGLPLISLVFAAIPFVALGIKSMALLLFGAPACVVGFLMAVVSIFRGAAVDRGLGVIGALANVPAMMWYGYFFFVGIC